MTVQVRRKTFDFLADDYKTEKPKVQLLPEGPSSLKSKGKLKTDCIMRWYLSLQGEDKPTASQTLFLKDAPTQQYIYRYDWAFGIALIYGFYWDWQKELPEEGALAIHVLLEALEEAPEALPVSATLCGLQPSRNTMGFWEIARSKIPKAIGDITKAGEPALPFLKYLSGGLTLASNVIESQAENQKNWFLYQFLDENLRCPTVEWRINRNVLREYGSLLRGSLFLAFSGATKSDPGSVRIQLRPQIRYYQNDEICYIIPTNELKDQQIYIEVKPEEENA